MPCTCSPYMYAINISRFWSLAAATWREGTEPTPGSQLCSLPLSPPAVHVPSDACATFHYGHMVAQLQGGNNKLKLSKQATEVALASLQAITALLAAGVGHADMLRAHLPALLTNIIQSSACQGVPDMVDRALACMYPFIAHPAGKTVLLQQLTPASVEPFIHVALRWLEDSESAYPQLVAASGWCLPVPLLPHTPL